MTSVSRIPGQIELPMLLIVAGWFGLFLLWPDTTTPKTMPPAPTATVITYVRRAEMPEDPTLVALPRVRPEFQRVDPAENTAAIAQLGVESDAGLLVRRRGVDDRRDAQRALRDRVQRATSGYHPQVPPAATPRPIRASDQPPVSMTVDGGLGGRKIRAPQWPMDVFTTEMAWSARAFVEVDPAGTVTRVLLESPAGPGALDAAIVAALHRCRATPGSDEAWGRIYLTFDPRRLRKQQVPDKDSSLTKP